MVDASGIARPFSPAQAAQDFADFKRWVQQQLSARRLESASIGKGGLSIQEGGSATVKDGGAFLVRDDADEVVARYGPLTETDVGQFGLEVKIGDTWIHIGAQVATWNNLAGKPSDFGPFVSSQVPDAAHADTAGTAGSAGTANQSDGVTQSAFNREVSGIPGSWYSMYMHSNGQIGRATSLASHKTNLRLPESLETDPYRALNIDPVVYDRKAGQDPDRFTPVSQVNEFGAIAEQVEEHVPELAEYFKGELRGVRHHLGWLSLIPAVRALRKRVADAEERAASLLRRVEAIESASGVTVSVRR